MHITEIEKVINSEGLEREIRLSGKIRIGENKSSSFTIGKTCVKGVVNIARENVIVDGSGAEIEGELEDSTGSDWALFFLRPGAREVTLRNITLRLRIKNGEDSRRLFCGIYNTAFGLKIENCRIELYSDKQLKLVGVYNNGNLDTHMQTRADNLVSIFNGVLL